MLLTNKILQHPMREDRYNNILYDKIYFPIKGTILLRFIKTAIAPQLSPFEEISVHYIEDQC